MWFLCSPVPFFKLEQTGRAQSGLQLLWSRCGACLSPHCPLQVASGKTALKQSFVYLLFGGVWLPFSEVNLVFMFVVSIHRGEEKLVFLAGLLQVRKDSCYIEVSHSWREKKRKRSILFVFFLIVYFKCFSLSTKNLSKISLAIQSHVYGRLCNLGL